MKDQDHGWATAVVTGSQGIGSEATLKLRLDDGGVLLEKLGSEVERLTKPEVQWMIGRQITLATQKIRISRILRRPASAESRVP